MLDRTHHAAVLCVLVALLALPLRADMRDAARNTVENHGDAVITVEVVQELTMSAGGQNNVSENKTETIGVVVDPSGLLVTSLVQIDPSGMIERMQGAEDMGFSAKVKEVTYILSDNSRVPATVVLRDVDLDIAVLRPIDTPAEPMVHVPLGNPVEPRLMDELYAVSRMGRIARRTGMAISGEVQGLVDRPRTYYIASPDIQNASLGVPVFAADGGLVGVQLLRVLPNSTQQEDRALAVIIPAADIADVVDQAPEADAGAAASEGTPTEM